MNPLVWTASAVEYVMRSLSGWGDETRPRVDFYDHEKLLLSITVKGKNGNVPSYGVVKSSPLKYMDELARKCNIIFAHDEVTKLRPDSILKVKVYDNISRRIAEYNRMTGSTTFIGDYLHTCYVHGYTDGNWPAYKSIILSVLGSQASKPTVLEVYDDKGQQTGEVPVSEVIKTHRFKRFRTGVDVCEDGKVISGNVSRLSVVDMLDYLVQTYNLLVSYKHTNSKDYRVLAQAIVATIYTIGNKHSINLTPRVGFSDLGAMSLVITTDTKGGAAKLHNVYSDQVTYYEDFIQDTLYNISQTFNKNAIETDVIEAIKRVKVTGNRKELPLPVFIQTLLGVRDLDNLRIISKMALHVESKVTAVENWMREILGVDTIKGLSYGQFTLFVQWLQIALMFSQINKQPLFVTAIHSTLVSDPTPFDRWIKFAVNMPVFSTGYVSRRFIVTIDMQQLQVTDSGFNFILEPILLSKAVGENPYGVAVTPLGFITSTPHQSSAWNFEKSGGFACNSDVFALAGKTNVYLAPLTNLRLSAVGSTSEVGYVEKMLSSRLYVKPVLTDKVDESVTSFGAPINHNDEYLGTQLAPTYVSAIFEGYRYVGICDLEEKVFHLAQNPRWKSVFGGIYSYTQLVALHLTGVEFSGVSSEYDRESVDLTLDQMKVRNESTFGLVQKGATAPSDRVYVETGVNDPFIVQTAETVYTRESLKFR